MQENTTQAPAQEQKPAGGKPYNLAPNVEAALSYVLGVISGVIVLVFEKENKFVRFHALQSVAFSLVSFVISNVVAYLPMFGGLVSMVWGLVSLFAWIYLMYKAYNNEEFELPVLGKFVRDQLGKL